MPSGGGGDRLLLAASSYGIQRQAPARQATWLECRRDPLLEFTCMKINAFLLPSADDFDSVFFSQMIVCSATLHSFEVKKLAVSFFCISKQS